METEMAAQMERRKKVLDTLSDIDTSQQSFQEEH